MAMPRGQLSRTAVTQGSLAPGQVGWGRHWVSQMGTGHCWASWGLGTSARSRVSHEGVCCGCTDITQISLSGCSPPSASKTENCSVLFLPGTIIQLPYFISMQFLYGILCSGTL